LYESVAQKKTGRYPICSGVFDYQILANIGRESFPELAEKGVIPVGNPDEKPSEKGTYLLDQSKAEKEFGLKGACFGLDSVLGDHANDHLVAISKEQLVKDVVQQMISIGAIKA
jgi:hypothetical protein